MPNDIDKIKYSDSKIDWKDKDIFEKQKNEFLNTIQYAEVPGGKINMFYSGQKDMSIVKHSYLDLPALYRSNNRRVTRNIEKNEQIPSIDVRGRKVLFLSDLHLFSKNKTCSVEKLELLKDIFMNQQEALIVLGGDTLELTVTSLEEIRKNIIEGQKEGGKKINKLIADIFQLLRDADTVLIPGNRDPLEIYKEDGFHNEIAKLTTHNLRIITDQGIGLLAHGNEVFKGFDETKFEGIKNVPKHVTKTATVLESIAINTIGDTFLESAYGKINDHFERESDNIKNAYGVDFVVFGHSHLQDINRESGMYISGVFQHGRGEFIHITEKGDIHPICEWYNEMARVAKNGRNVLSKILKPNK